MLLLLAFALGMLGIDGMGALMRFTCAKPWHAVHEARGLSMGPFSRPRKPRCICCPRLVLIHCSFGALLANTLVTSLPHMRPTGTMCFHQSGDVEASFSY